jgi:hypothetical protein
MSSTLRQFHKLVRAAAAVLEREEITVPCAAELLKKKPEWIRANLPVIVHSPKCHHVLLADIKAYQSRRTLKPQNARRSACDNGR